MRKVDGWLTFTAGNIPPVMRDEKTNARRVAIPQPYPSKMGDDLWTVKTGRSRQSMSLINANAWDVKYWLSEWCSHRVGDILSVKEGYQITNVTGKSNGIVGRYLADDAPFCVNLSDAEATRFGMRKYPKRVTSSRFMYHSLARTFLKVLSVRVERVQDITVADCYAEGIPHSAGYPGSKKALDAMHRRDRQSFINLWNSINKKRGFGWDANPWVFAYGFERLTE